MLIKGLRRRMSRLASILAVGDHRVEPGRRPFVLYTCHDADRSMVADGKRYSPLLQGIRSFYDELGFGAANLSHPFAVAPGYSVRDGSITINRHFIALRLRGLASRVFGGGGSRLQAETDLFRDVLEKLDPSFIVSIQPPLGLCRAARSLGIGVVEAMHGTNYSLADKRFEAHMSLSEENLPHAMLCFDETSLATIQTRIADRSMSVFLSDDPWKHMMRYAGMKEVSLDSVSTSTARPRTILITLQWGYDGERDTLSGIIPNGILHPALEAAMVSDACRNVQFLVRLHPIQMIKPGYGHHRKYIAALAERNPLIEWEKSTSDPLPALLDKVDGHITMSSSAVGEASDDGIPSLTLCPTLHEGGAHFGFFREIEQKGLLTFGLPQADSIIDWIMNCKRVHHASAQPMDVRHQELLKQYGHIASVLKESAKVQRRGSGA